MKLIYEDNGFPIAARKLLAAGEPLVFDLRGIPWERLRPHVVENEVPRWSMLAAIPELERFTVVMALAKVSKAKVRVVPVDDYAEVHVGSTH
jgi:hypothetical protein